MIVSGLTWQSPLPLKTLQFDGSKDVDDKDDDRRGANPPIASAGFPILLGSHDNAQHSKDTPVSKGVSHKNWFGNAKEMDEDDLDVEFG